MLVEAPCLFPHRLKRELVFDRAVERASGGLPRGGMLNHKPKRMGERARIFGRHEEAASFVRHDFGDSADCRRNDREPRAPRLKKRVAERSVDINSPIELKIAHILTKTKKSV